MTQVSLSQLNDFGPSWIVHAVGWVVLFVVAAATRWRRDRPRYGIRPDSVPFDGGRLDDDDGRRWRSGIG